MFKNLDFDVDRAVFLGLFGAIGGVLLADKVPAYQKYITAKPEYAAPMAAGALVVGDLAFRMATAKKRGA